MVVLTVVYLVLHCQHKWGQNVRKTITVELNLPQALGSEVFRVLLALKVHRDHRVHQVVTVDQFPTVETSLERQSALKSRSI